MKKLVVVASLVGCLVVQHQNQAEAAGRVMRVARRAAVVGAVCVAAAACSHPAPVTGGTTPTVGTSFSAQSKFFSTTPTLEFKDEAGNVIAEATVDTGAKTPSALIKDARGGVIATTAQSVVSDKKQVNVTGFGGTTLYTMGEIGKNANQWTGASENAWTVRRGDANGPVIAISQRGKGAFGNQDYTLTHPQSGALLFSVSSPVQIIHAKYNATGTGLTEDPLLRLSIPAANFANDAWKAAQTSSSN